MILFLLTNKFSSIMTPISMIFNFPVKNSLKQLKRIILYLVKSLRQCLYTLLICGTCMDTNFLLGIPRNCRQHVSVSLPGKGRIQWFVFLLSQWSRSCVSSKWLDHHQHTEPHLPAGQGTGRLCTEVGKSLLGGLVTEYCHLRLPCTLFFHL